MRAWLEGERGLTVSTSAIDKFFAINGATAIKNRVRQ